MGGTLGPFVQGASRSPALRIKVGGAFVLAFALSASVVFASVAVAGWAVGLGALPLPWRRAAAGAGAVALAAVDLGARRRGAYSPLGWRRQTPRTLMFHHPAPWVAAVWGLDVGAVFTTIRVASLTWAALAWTLLGLAPWWTGAAYAAGFLIPVTALVLSPRVGRAAVSRVPADPGLEALLARRGPVQGAAAALLAAGGLATLLSLLA